MPDKDIEKALLAIKDNDDYVLIEKIKVPDCYNTLEESDDVKTGVCIDIETTGLDFSCDKIIEIGYVLFKFDRKTGAIGDVFKKYASFEDPLQELSEKIIRLTGITDDDVKGTSFDYETLKKDLSQADLFIAHNAGFDRKFLEKKLPFIENSHWACSMNEIDWEKEDVFTKKLDYIAYKNGFFFDHHRAVNDSLALLHILSKNLPVSGKNALYELLTSARQKSRKFFCLSAPFAKKDDLKARGYHWNYEGCYIDVNQYSKKGFWAKNIKSETEREEEALWLAENIYNGTREFYSYKDNSALDRYSVREDDVGNARLNPEFC